MSECLPTVSLPPAIFLMGGLVTLVFIVSGSIWPAIALHIYVDVINNSMVWKARGIEDAAQAS